MFGWDWASPTYVYTPLDMMTLFVRISPIFTSFTANNTLQIWFLLPGSFACLKWKSWKFSQTLQFDSTQKLLFKFAVKFGQQISFGL